MASCEARWVGERERARALLSAIEADDPEMFSTELNELEDGSVEIVIRVEGDSIPAIQSAMDDLLACLAVAEASLDVIHD
ncbi:MAG: KEOPS complex subunit Pcc1 [Candidatus Thermoplasmatota archaeon]|nr:KEOPS complex subunit Pcc1 [Candidatus Thermoplasmatota archaeon]